MSLVDLVKMLSIAFSTRQSVACFSRAAVRESLIIPKVGHKRFVYVFRCTVEMTLI